MPQPTTTGGGLMGYPTSVDTGGVPPLFLNAPGIENAAATITLVAGAAYFTAITLLAPTTITQMRCYFSGSPTGNVDMGVYDSTAANGAPNNMLGHTGAFAAATGLFTKSLTANLPLSPGNYWLALVDTVADVPQGRGIVTAGAGISMRTSATNLTVLPATAGTVADNNLWPVIMALVSGGFS